MSKQTKLFVTATMSALILTLALTTTTIGMQKAYARHHGYGVELSL
jgi:hypothetical protein